MQRTLLIMSGNLTQGAGGPNAVSEPAGSFTLKSPRSSPLRADDVLEL